MEGEVITFKWERRVNDPNVQNCEADGVVVGGYITSQSAVLPFFDFYGGIRDCDTEEEARAKVESLANVMLAAYREWEAANK